jgi:hypothetical protein
MHFSWAVVVAVVQVMELPTVAVVVAVVEFVMLWEFL